VAITQQQAIASTVIQQILGNLNTVTVQPQNLGAKRVKLAQTVDRQGVIRFREVEVK
tara:strand:+ start:174 stop:344 length:171 start_codon:yes stop_codon:yes gene_type:complete